MPTVHFTSAFERSFKKLTKRNELLRQKVKKSLANFVANPQHPSLNLEKLAGLDVWTIRADKSNRLFFVWSDEGGSAVFFLVGRHDIYRKLRPN